MTDPLAPLADLPGVPDAGEQAREALGRAHRHRANLRGWPATAAEAALRAARASSVLDGGALQFSADSAPDPVLAGALRVSEALEGGETSLVGVWRRAPLQAIARLHALAAVDITDDESLGRPRGDTAVGPRLTLLADVVTGSRTPAPVLAAVVHGELLALAPFGTADGVVARAAARLVTMTTGLDPHGLGVPEVYWMRRSGDYRAALRGFSSGTPDGLTAWILMSCRGLAEGAREALAIAEAASS
ncbi:oxidoreductase [Mycobacterium sp. IDR2000157661]|uniref:oxidoreductase n=1 Tax=Mycobacterium sp. IDR2000157661 TaxID=2867005 RepID=UPI001EEE2346|nr:oxidoreductase [Mycobacterium sp. IDR2000157661]ULE35040.1 oxidoreductase [Mycobacterium sp. IDR2000157661]